MRAGERRVAQAAPNRVEGPGPSDSSARFVGVRPEAQGAARIPPAARYSGPMSAQRPLFDSHRFVKRLTMAGLAEEVAEILADEHTKLIVPEDVATKDDVGAVSADLGTVKAEMATKTDLEAVSADLGTVKAEMATKTDLGAVSADLGTVKAEMATKTDLGAVSADLGTVKAEMATKTDLGAVSADLGTVKAEMATKTDLGVVSADLAAVSAKVDRVSNDLDRVSNDLDGVKAVMATKEDLRREIAASEARMEQRMQSAILEAKVSLIKWMIATNLATMAVFSGIVIGAMSALQ